MTRLLLLLFSCAACAQETVAIKPEFNGGQLLLALQDSSGAQFARVVGSCLQASAGFDCEEWAVAFFYPSAVVRVYSVDSFLRQTRHSETQLCNASETNALELSRHRIGVTTTSASGQEGCLKLLSGNLAVSAYAWDLVGNFADYLNDPLAQQTYTPAAWINKKSAVTARRMYAVFTSRQLLP